MQVHRIGTRGYLFIFAFGDAGTDTTNVYVIDGSRHRYIVDTFLGPEAMDAVRSHLGENGKPTIVVNTHAHFDHFWGNCAFPDAIVVGHTLCKQGIERQQQLDYLAKHADQQMGQVKIVGPSVTFEKRLIFEEDEVELFHSPGHTRDSISCIDRKDRVLLVGDNIGLPIPSIYPGVQVQEFVETLETYQALALPTVVSSHYNEIETDLIASNLAYLRRLAADDTAEYDHGEFKVFNDWNKKMIARQA